MLSDPANEDEEELPTDSSERIPGPSDGETDPTDSNPQQRTRVDVRDIRDGSGRYVADTASIRTTTASYQSRGWRLTEQRHIPGSSPAVAGYTRLTFSKP